jgi:hypothetical protein
MASFEVDKRPCFVTLRIIWPHFLRAILTSVPLYVRPITGLSGAAAIDSMITPTPIG